jgi:putative transcriptional regulator
MTIKHHPSDATLASFSSGALDESRALVVATHLSLCLQCRNAVRAFELVAGALLDGVPPAEMIAGALDRIMAKLDTPNTIAEPRSSNTSVSDSPAPLSHYRLGPWRWIGPGLHWRAVDVEPEGDVRVFMLRASPRARLPRHSHTGTEWTCVIEGAFRHDLGRFGPGDFDEADETHDHNPVVEEGAICVCLVALQGNIKLQSLVGRLIQPLIRL